MSAVAVEQRVGYQPLEGLVNSAGMQGHFLDALKGLVENRFEFDITQLPAQWDENTTHLIKDAYPAFAPEAQILLGVLVSFQEVVNDHIDPLRSQIGLPPCPTVGRLASMLLEYQGDWKKVLKTFGRLQENIQGAGALAAIAPIISLKDLAPLISTPLPTEAQNVLKVAMALVPTIMILSLGDKSYWVNPDQDIERPSLDTQNTGGLEEPWNN